MAAFPPEGAFEPGAAGEKPNSSMDEVFEAFLAACKQLPGGKPEQALTLDTNGKIAPSSAFVRIDTFGASSTDDLVGIDPANMQTTDGAKHGLVWVRTADSARKITVKHNAGSTSEIFLADSQDLQLSSSSMRLGLFYTGTQWLEIYRHYGTQDVPARAALGLGGAAVMDESSVEEADDGGDDEDDSVITPRRLKRYRPKASGELTIGAGVKNDFTHSLGSVPSQFWGVLVCKTAQLGWVADNRIQVDQANIAVWADATKVGFVCNDDPFTVINWTNGASGTLTYANWRIVLFAVK
jgi:hypothetical protein